MSISSLHRTDTVFARASAQGKCGVAVYRLSGPETRTVFGTIIPHTLEARTANLVTLSCPLDGTEIDTGLAIFFPAPASFTGEDVLEFHLHGSPAIEAALFDALFRAGFRQAGPGEFTLRAFRNGKLDLPRVEALSDLIDSETNLQRTTALGQFHGRLSVNAGRWRKKLLAIISSLEAMIDFSDEADVSEHICLSTLDNIDALADELTKHLELAEIGKEIRDGVTIALIGLPNAGKSSLLNALSGSPHSIVSDIPGTTRDIVRVRLDLDGIPVTFADTAGLHGSTSDPVELEGIKRARSCAEEAFFRLAVVCPDGSPVPPVLTDLLRDSDILVYSHADMNPALPPCSPSGIPVFSVSSVTGEGIPDLLRAVAARFSRHQSESPLLSRVRHIDAVRNALLCFSSARRHLPDAVELAAEDLRSASCALALITGAIGVEDHLSEIFSGFCIGK